MSFKLTKSTESLAATASISAHDTTPAHALSTALFIASITSNPLAEFKLGTANFSLSLPSNSNDASQPYTKIMQIHNSNLEVHLKSFVSKNFFDSH